MEVTTLLQNLFAPTRRLYTLEGDGPLADLAVEAWLGREALSELFEWRVVAVSANARIALKSLLGQRVTLVTTLADGTQTKRTGLIRLAEKLGADGSLTRYRLTVVPWFWLTTQQRHSQVFQNRPLADIIEQMLSPYEPYASWRYAAGAEARMSDFGTRAHIAQFRETDYHFVTRLLAEAGLGFTTVEDDQAHGGHTLVIFADSTQLPEDTESAAAGGIRFHRAHSLEERDAIQQLACHSRTTVGGVAVAAWDPEGKQNARAHAPARFATSAGSPDAYLSISPSLAPDSANAQRIAEQVMESLEARALLFSWRGTVRTLRSGTRLQVVDCPHLPQDVEGAYPLLMDLVEHCGINNLTVDTHNALSQRLGGLDAALAFDTPPSAPESGPGVFGFQEAEGPVERSTPTGDLLKAARAHGYAGVFRAGDARRPWRPAVTEPDCGRLYAAPTAQGVHSAIVVGPDGQTQAGGDGEHHASPAGEIRVRFPWQQGERADDRSSRWVRVAQRQAGSGMGWQWLPRIGQEVLVKFSEDDIDQPVVIGSLYNGQGEAGIAPTPGGQGASDQSDSTALYKQGSDSAASAQGNVAGGHSPAWHGMGTEAEGHRNAAAHTGFKSAEHGGSGYNHLVFDDTKGQIQAQLSSDHLTSQISMGYLTGIPNHAGRQDKRGEGLEARTDGHASLRAALGLLLTTHRRDKADGGAMSVEDVIALMQEALTLADSLAQSAINAQAQAGQQKEIAKALRLQTEAIQGGGKLAEFREPHITIASQAGIATSAPGSTHVASGEHIALTSGQHLSFSSGGGMYATATERFSLFVQRDGIKLFSAKGKVEVQAQSDAMDLVAQKVLRLLSTTDWVEISGKKGIRLNVGGNEIRITPEGIENLSAGKWAVYSGSKLLTGRKAAPYAMPTTKLCTHLAEGAAASGAGAVPLH